MNKNLKQIIISIGIAIIVLAIVTTMYLMYYYNFPAIEGKTIAEYCASTFCTAI